MVVAGSPLISHQWTPSGRSHVIAAFIWSVSVVDWQCSWSSLKVTLVQGKFHVRLAAGNLLFRGTHKLGMKRECLPDGHDLLLYNPRVRPRSGKVSSRTVLLSCLMFSLPALRLLWVADQQLQASWNASAVVFPWLLPRYRYLRGRCSAKANPNQRQQIHKHNGPSTFPFSLPNAHPSEARSVCR